MPPSDRAKVAAPPPFSRSWVDNFLKELNRRLDNEEEEIALGPLVDVGLLQGPHFDRLRRRALGLGCSTHSKGAPKLPRSQWQCMMALSISFLLIMLKVTSPQCNTTLP